jgi:hypothetical protein
MKHQKERDEGVRCGTVGCMWYDVNFRFSCRGYQDNLEKTLSPKPSCCHEYTPSSMSVEAIDGGEA